MKNSLLRFVVALGVSVVLFSSALAQQESAPLTVTAHCYSMKARDALDFIVANNPTGTPDKAFGSVRDLAKARKATHLGDIAVASGAAAQRGEKVVKDLQLESEYIPGQDNVVSVNAAVKFRNAQVIGSTMVSATRGSKRAGEEMIKGLGYIGCGYTDSTKSEVFFVFTTVGK